ncbi:MAG: single-stranded-DNA-specific exonuclease RecJ, partial [Thermostichales cyanobacterium HHBFW_bins_127]
AMKWLVSGVPPQFSSEVALALGKYAAKILALRGITDPVAAKAFVDPGAYRPTPGWELPDMRQAVDRIVQAKKSGEKIVIWGDFDCDGVTSTALLWWAMQPLKLNLSYTVPLRNGEGHGLNERRLRQLAQQGTKLVITVDCGVANHAEVDLAYRLGMEVIITDHHTLPLPLPSAHAVINPLRLPEDHPLRFLPGVGVAYKLAECLYETFGIPGVEKLLDLAATGIVADVAVLQRECRYLVQQGLPVLANSPHLGLAMLVQRETEEKKGGLKLALSATDIGFRLAPKLNAIGRLDDAHLAIELLTTADPKRAQTLIDQFVAANQQRRQLSEQVFSEAAAQAEGVDLSRQRALVLAGEGWNSGVVGIAAAKMVEKYGVPTVLIGIDREKQVGHGSGRSIPSVNMAQAIEAVRPLLLGGGGHPMAAGLGVSLDNLPALQVALTRELGSRVSSDITEPELVVEVFLDANQQNLDLVAELDQIFRELQALEPYGHGHPRPVVGIMNLKPDHARIIPSRDGRHLSWEIKSRGQVRKIWLWHEGSRLEELVQVGRQSGWDLAFVMEPSGFGKEPWSGKLKGWRLGGEWQPTQVEPVDLTIYDARGQAFTPKPGQAVYAGEIPAPAPELVLKQWPLFPEELGDLLQAVRPSTVILAGTGMDTHQMAERLPAFVQAWEGGHRRLAPLMATGIPREIVERCLQGAGSHPAIGMVLLELLQECQAFQEWLATAPSGDIRKLCRRFVRA